MSKQRAGTDGTRAEARGFQLGPGVWTRLRYQVKDAEGELVEGAGGEVGLVFGYGSLLPALEAALDGLGVGARRSVELAARDAYGERKPELEVEFSRDEFPPDVAPGVRLELERDDGSEVVARVLDVSEDAVVMDLNHPLAGQSVRYEIEVLEARAATAAELELAESQALALEDPGPEGFVPAGDLVRKPPGPS
jgi:FKBP-type peptidyl-prolyl cis-trans isomerase SlyD